MNYIYIRNIIEKSSCMLGRPSINLHRNNYFIFCTNEWHYKNLNIKNLQQNDYHSINSKFKLYISEGTSIPSNPRFRHLEHLIPRPWLWFIWWLLLNTTHSWPRAGGPSPAAPSNGCWRHGKQRLGHGRLFPKSWSPELHPQILVLIPSATYKPI